MAQKAHDVSSPSGGKGAVFINKSPAHDLTDNKRAEIRHHIVLLIEKFDQLSPKKFKIECQKVINSYGFSVFRDVFDQVLIEQSGVKNFQNKSKAEQHAAAFSAINNYLDARFLSTASQIALKSAKMQAQIVLKVMSEDSKSLHKEAILMATNNKQAPYEEVKNKALSKIELETAAQIDKIEKKIGLRKKKHMLLQQLKILHKNIRMQLGLLLKCLLTIMCTKFSKNVLKNI